MNKVFPSKNIWNYYSRTEGPAITPDLITVGIADFVGGYHVSYTMMELLKDLKIITSNGNITKAGLRLMAGHVHNKYFHNKEGFIVIDPNN